MVILGTRRGFRKRGLGKAMLLSGMQRLRDVGMDKALLGVDAENPSGATRLYESVGFRKVHTNIFYVKEF
ncbi:GNAT family N-acetyltransferase [Hydrocoleum sp. CS-953]|uniref:GNAT family N-acetyltransferase n=1 Tax=Hydrocoleum sp. CS-953 TaxID=1671698 RepID=UPI00352AB7C3